MKVEGRERATHGFTTPADGWHICEILEGIDYAKNGETKEILEDKKGAKKHIIKFHIVDEDDEANGSQLSMFVTENPRGEQQVADVLAATGQYKKFAEKFPGDVSVFDENVMSAIKIKLPGQFLKVRTKVAKVKDKEYVNIQETATMSFDPAKDEKNAKGKGKDKAADKTETKAAAKSDEW
jgi:hypothetical protein